MIRSCILTVIGGLLFLASLPLGASLVSANNNELSAGPTVGAADNETLPEATRRIWEGLWAGANLDFDGATDSQTALNNAADNDGATNPGNPTSASAQPLQSVNGRYVAMGDSIAAGLGLVVSPSGDNQNSNQNNSGSQQNEQCGRSTQAYPYAVAEARQLQLSHVACSGASAGDLITPQGVSGPNISRQISAVFASGPQPGLITATAGANDAQWARFIYKCYQFTCGTATDTTIANGALVLLQAKLFAFFGELQLRSSGQPPTTVVTGYYNPLSAACNTQDSLQGNNRPQAGRLSTAELAWIEATVAALNQTIEQVASQFSFARFAAVDFEGHDLCSSDPWIQGLNDPAPIHPTAEGQRAIADTVLNVL